MRGFNKTIVFSIILSMGTSLTAFAGTENDQVLEQNIYNHMKNWETSFSFSYEESSAINLLQSAAKKDDYLERSIAVYKTAKSGNNYDVEIEYRTTKDQEKYIDSELNRIVNNLIDPRMTELEKVEAVNNYLVKIFKYDDNHLSDNVYTALTTGTTICQGYAMAAYKMFNIMGIECRIVSGNKGDISHAWNLVKINNQWYHLDITNNDNVVRNKYLLKSDSYLRANSYVWNASDFPQAPNDYFDKETEYLDYNNDKETDIKEYYNGGYWYQAGQGWHYKRDSGYDAVGWINNDGSFYYLGTDGIMKTGWIKDNGKWYYCYDNGKMAANTIIDGYKLEADGSCAR